MAKKNFYAVRKGTKTGIFDSWEACRSAVTGYPGAEFKGFGTEEEAKAWLSETLVSETDIAAEAQDSETNPVAEAQGSETDPAAEAQAEHQLIAYVDGSYDQSAGRYAYGCIFLTPEGETIRRSGSGKDPEALALHNVAGEMLGAMYAVKWAEKNGYESIELRYDYEGIEKWVTGSWRTNNALTQKYAEFMRGQRRVLSIRFRKVRAHTGDHYNEEADKLAKSAVAYDGISDDAACLSGQ